MTDTDIDTMTVEQCRSAAQQLLDNTEGDLTGEAAQRFEQLSQRVDHLREQQRQRVTASRDMVARLASGELRVEAGSVQPSGQDDQDRPPALQQRDAGMRALDSAVKANRLAARGAELVENLMNQGPAPAQSWTRRYAAAAGSEHYERAFAKLLADPTHGHLTWTPEESDAYRAADAVLTEQRAMSLTDSAGGFLVPLTLDPTVLLTSSGSTNPLRQISRIVQTTTDSWNGVTSAGVTAEWIAEATEVADASPTLGQPTIPVYKGDAFVPFSFEVEGDALGFMSELGKLLQDGADQLTATAYTTGSGTGQPTGVITRVAGTGGSVVSPITPETLASGDVFAVQNALPPRFQPRAVWNANLALINTLRQFETSNGALKFPELAQNPPQLLGRTVYENSNMDGTYNPAVTENNYLLLYGDFSQFVIVDRIGSTLELVPHLFGSSRRPTGQRGALLWFRTGSDVVITNAFRLLNVATTA
ncbi:major capsid protein [Mycobacterium sp. 852002-51163_SCH5372311]|uniref:phage major capsid protein n=1 Tax=Mycobacterium sp. 852002-51163_SCH5372311 TaxID=1834097 RepID=UPI0007FBC40F|nr:phage major capsid protein [Mycobacterium sp. 852002-51163_SCH5372311]OBF91046.1 major capsid protein [Mycobacterium sp. 852002-51163_SCH5372311]